MRKKTLHLICNAHLDPVWLWEWEEGAAEAVSTFRVAADFCEQYDTFVFNHNEVILYEWVEKFEPELFKRIQRLVKQGKWRIMGGWYLQPDCNIPSGESLVRQILLGRRYFSEKFGVAPTTAINFDPFGHSRGLVQILAKSGYDSYFFCRPTPTIPELEAETFIWEGFDGSQVMASRAFGSYLTLRGKAREKAEKRLAEPWELNNEAVCWGIGNHGGGPSRVDMKMLEELMKESEDAKIIHSNMEDYFAKVADERERLPVRGDDLNPFSVGCYTSQIEIKQKHRALENELFMTEKMAATAWSLGLLPYPSEKMTEAMKTLAHSEFHDILPGSSIQAVEKSSIRLMDYGLELLARIKAETFFALARGEKKAKEGEIPILVYNPHPFPVETDVECEFQLADQNWNDTFTDVKVKNGDAFIPSQVEKEASNLNLDWRKKVVFHATLAPSAMNRFDCVLEEIASKPAPNAKFKNCKLELRNEAMTLEINGRTGLIDKFELNGVDIIRKGAFKPLVMKDDPDAWGMKVDRFAKKAGCFKLMNSKEAAAHAGVSRDSLPPVRVVEEGAVRTVVEAAFKYGDSFLLITYKIPKQGAHFEVETRVNWNEKDKMLKLSVPTSLIAPRFLGQTAYGVQKLPDDGREAVAQKWVALAESDGNAVAITNDGTHGFSSSKGEMRLTLLRSPAYSGHPIGERELVPQDRFTPRIDQGERIFKFQIVAGAGKKILEETDFNALAFNEKPMPLSFFPSGDTCKPLNGVRISTRSVVLTAMKKAEHDEKLVMRFFESTGKRRSAEIAVPMADFERRFEFGPFEIKTLIIDLKTKKYVEGDLLA